jgi:hypothetical protein
MLIKDDSELCVLCASAVNNLFSSSGFGDLTAEARRALSKELLIKKLSGLCVLCDSAVNMNAACHSLAARAIQIYQSNNLRNLHFCGKTSSKLFMAEPI